MVAARTRQSRWQGNDRGVVMARKTTVFFLILVLGSLTDISWAQSAGPTGSSQVLRWSSPRPQVRQVSTEPRLLTPSDKGTADS